ncbi:MAG TPA: gamma-glutamyltransferase [Thermoanaerobaculia bacterium]|jgi:gamma-glutamyltranspeptidase/glutathione hydrolase|nr:gamma-glutamyltransferase [Thermoanaerobaculia bacterium]
MRTLTILVLLLLLPLSARAASTPAPLGTGGAVAAADPRATKVGIEILRAGGNAVDAAVATALALAVVYPEAGNLGGGGFAVIRINGKLLTLDFRETGPAAARADMYLDAKGEPVPYASLHGPLAAGVPGSPAGLYELHRKLGRLPWKKVVEPARRLAAEGFRVDRHLADLIATEEHRQLLGLFPETAKVWLPGGKPPEAGSVIRLPELAANLAAYAERGPEALTTGPVAAAVEATSKRHGGVLTAADMAAYQPVWREPVVFDAFGWKFATMPLPSSGGLLTGEILGMLERLEWAKMPRFGADRAHFLTEAFRRAYADRFLLADPSTSKAGPAQLLDPVWLEQRAASIAPRRATPSAEVHPWPGTEGGDKPEPTETTHLSIADADGNLVALTTTLNGLFGCGLYVPEAGFFLNNEMDDFATAPGRPNLFGLVQGEANAVAPAKRMLSSMTPTIAWKGDEAVALGGRGGSRIPTNTIEVLLNLIADGDSLQTALDRPRIHHQWLPDRLEAEADALSPETRAELERRGHEVYLTDVAAKVHAVHVRADGRMEAASDPRGTGVGAVVKPEP